MSSRVGLTREDLDEFSEAELTALERRLARLLAVWEIQNVRGQERVFHDDQHIGEPRRELQALDHPAVDAPALLRARRSPVVDSLEGNALVQSLTTAVVEVDEDATKARGVWGAFGLEGLSKFREKPTAIWSVGAVPGALVVQDGEWKILGPRWQRLVKADYRFGWVRSMIPTNMRPPLTPEQDRAMLGRFAYRKDEARLPVPIPPTRDTWVRYPDEASTEWTGA